MEIANERIDSQIFVEGKVGYDRSTTGRNDWIDLHGPLCKARKAKLSNSMWQSPDPYINKTMTIMPGHQTRSKEMTFFFILSH
jgi:hypothetical protein